MKNIILLFVSTIMLNTTFAQVSINEDNSAPDVSAMLDIKSSDKGILVPRMSSAQRTLISNPAIGLLVFDMTTASFWFYNGSVWNNLSAISNKRIADADNDTKIQVEESADEDIIRFDMAGTEFFRMDSGRLDILSTGRSVFIGEEAGGNDDLTNNANVFVGYQAGQDNTSGENNVALGASTLNQNITGSNNVAMGVFSLFQNIDGDNNIAIGDRNLANNTSGNRNVSLGTRAGFTSIGDRNIFMGNSAGYYETGSNKLYIENTVFSTPLIYGDFANDSLKIYGTLGIRDNYTFPNTDGAANEVLQTDGTGNASWQAVKGGAILGPNHTSEPDSSCLSTLGSLDAGASPESVAVSGNYAYVVESVAGDLDVIDVSDPTNPVLKGSVSVSALPKAVAVSGIYAYVVGGPPNGLNVIDVSDPVNPSLVGSLSIGTIPTSVATLGNFAYVVDQGSNDLKVIDVSDPTNPTLSGSLGIGATPLSVVVAGNYAYVVDRGSDDLKVIDVSDPTSPTLSGSLGIGARPASVAISGHYAYVVDTEFDDLKVIDVSDPTNPTLSGSLGIGDRPQSVAISANYAYVVDTDSDDLKVIDVSDPASPTLSASLGIGATPRSVAILGYYAYVVDTDSDDLKVIDVSCHEVLAFDPISGVFVATPVWEIIDAQTLTYSGTTLSITGGNSVNLSFVLDNLGDHIADTIIQLNGNYISNDGGNEGIAINNNGNVGIGTTAATNILHIAGVGGIQLTNSEIGNVNENPGTILFDANYFGDGQAGAGHFNDNGGGLAIYDGTDGWGAIVSTANMQYLELDLSSLHIGGTSDPGDGNLIVDGVVKIASGNPGNGKILTSNAVGDATWKNDQSPDILFANTTVTQSFSNSDVWRAVTPWTSSISNDNSEALFELEATITSRLTSGGGNDDFDFRVEMDFAGVTFYSDVFSYRPDELSGEHDNFKTVPYLFFLNPPIVGGNVKFRLNVRNTGDDAWQVEDCILFVTKY